MPDRHALLSASSSKQWLNCPPSARLQEQFPNESSVYAAEGTFAHEVCEYKVRKYLKERVKHPQSEEYYTEEIDQITEVYAEFVISIIEEMKRRRELEDELDGIVPDLLKNKKTKRKGFFRR